MWMFKIWNGSIDNDTICSCGHRKDHHSTESSHTVIHSQDCVRYCSTSTSKDGFCYCGHANVSHEKILRIDDTWPT